MVDHLICFILSCCSLLLLADVFAATNMSCLMSTYGRSIQFDERFCVDVSNRDSRDVVKGNQPNTHTNLLTHSNLSIILLLIGSHQTTLRHTFHTDHHVNNNFIATGFVTHCHAFSIANRLQVNAWIVCLIIYDCYVDSPNSHRINNRNANTYNILEI